MKYTVQRVKALIWYMIYVFMFCEMVCYNIELNIIFKFRPYYVLLCYILPMLPNSYFIMMKRANTEAAATQTGESVSQQCFNDTLHACVFLFVTSRVDKKRFSRWRIFIEMLERYDNCLGRHREFKRENTFILYMQR